MVFRVKYVGDVAHIVAFENGSKKKPPLHRKSIQVGRDIQGRQLFQTAFDLFCEECDEAIGKRRGLLRYKTSSEEN